MRFLSALSASIALAALTINLGCNYFDCAGHDPGETYCDQDRVVECRDESDHHEQVTLKQCMPGGCFQLPSTGTLECKVPGYTCPPGDIGYHCLEERRIVCEPDGTALDFGDCTRDLLSRVSSQPQSWTTYWPKWGPHCVENPGGGALACGYSKERCGTAGEVRCLENGAAVCLDSVWQYFLSSRLTGQSTCDATTIRYFGVCRAKQTWCEGDQILRCDRCVVSTGNDGGYCTNLTKLAECAPGTCSTKQSDSSPSTLTGCTQSEPNCGSAGQMICVGDRPGYCLQEGAALVGAPCSELPGYGPVCQAIFDYRMCTD